MISGGNIKPGYVLHFFCAVAFLWFSVSAQAQTKNYATVAVSSSNTLNPSFATDSNLTTRAELQANCGLLGAGATTGEVIIEFAAPLAANTTTFVKVATQETLLSSLIQGGLGTLVAALLGSQEFTVEARNGATVVLTGNSNTPANFATENLRVVQNVAGEYFIRITPAATYNRIRIVNRFVAILGLAASRSLYVYDAYTISGSAVCGEPLYTSGSATSVVNLGDAGIDNPANVLTPSTTDFSTLKMGLLGVGPSVEQTVYFEGPADATDTFAVRLSAGASLLTAGVATNISVIASYQGAAVQTRTLAQLLLANGVTMTGGTMTTVYMNPGAQVDRINIRFSSFLSTGAVAQNLNFYGVTKTLGAPAITAYSAICSGSTILLTGTGVAGSQIKWYNVASGGTPLVTVNSGSPVMSSALTANAIFYAEQVSGSCTGIRVAVPVTVVAKPVAGTIAGDQTVCHTRLPAQITSVSADAGAAITYRWESSLDGVTWTPIASNTTAYQPTMLLKSTFFRRITIHTLSGISCESLPSNQIKVTSKNCMVYANPMVRQRVKTGA